MALSGAAFLFLLLHRLIPPLPSFNPPSPPSPPPPDQAGDPNSASAPVLWPAWEGRKLTGHGGATGTLALDNVFAAGRGGAGNGLLLDDFSQAWLRAAGAGAGAGGGGWSGGSGSYFLEIKDHPEVREAELDCICEFWGKTKYRH